MPRTTTTLLAQAQQHADECHRSRLAELKLLAPLLAQLDAFAPELERRGFQIYGSSISLWHLSSATPCGTRRKVARIQGPLFLHHSGRPNLFTALVDLGFQLVKHEAASAYPTAHLRHGKLFVAVDLSRPEAEELRAASARAELAAKAAQPVAA